MKFIPEDVGDLIEVTDTDIRYVAVVWNGGEDTNPELHYAGCSEYEALGLLRAAVVAVEATAANLMILPAELEIEGDEDA